MLMNHVVNALPVGRFTLDEKNHQECARVMLEEDADLLLSVANQIEGRTICAFGSCCMANSEFYSKVQRRI